MASEFEQKYLRQTTYWIDSITIDALASAVKVLLVVNPESQEIDGELRFEEIIEYQGIYHDSEFDQNYMPFLCGIYHSETSNGTKYIITTDTIEIS